MPGLINTNVIARTISPSSAEYLNLIIKQAPDSYIIDLCSVSVTVLLLWDMMITYDQEIELIWRSRRNIVNYLFFVIRYLALGLSVMMVIVNLGRFPKQNLCRTIYEYVFCICSVVLLSTGDMLLVYRIFAFYERNRKVLVGLITLWLLNIAALLVLSILYSMEVHIVHIPTVIKQGITGECIVSDLPAFVRDIWVSELVFHGILYILVIARSIYLLTTVSWKTSAISRVYYIFIRDGFCVFAHLLVVFIISALRLNIAPDTVITQGGILIIGMTGSRLVLNLRSLNNPSCDHYNYWIGKKILFDTIGVVEPGSDESGMNSFELTPLSPTSATNMD